LKVCFLEAILRDDRDNVVGTFPIAGKVLADRAVAAIAPTRDLKLLDLRGDGPARMGIPSDVIRGAKQSLARAWSVAFHQPVAKLVRHQRVVIALSVHILRGGVARCSDARVDVVEVRLALRCLLPYCPERWPLELYWDAAGRENEIGRAQGVTAAFNGIVRQLRRAGCYEEVLEP
jgi:hypothetical protein